MTFLFNPWVWLAALLTLGGAYAGGRWHQYQYDQKAQMAVVIEATVKARAQEETWQKQTKGIEDAHQTELQRVAAERDAALAGLRDRAITRLPPTAKCSDNARSSTRIDIPAANAGLPQGKPAEATVVAGATGAQLAAPDAEFLTKYAASADTVSSDLRSCQAWVKAVLKEQGDK